MRHAGALKASTAAQPIDYLDFIRSKIITLPPIGLPMAANDVHPILKDHQRALVRWAVEGGRRAIFAAFGLGKSLIQLEIMRQIGALLGGRQLIVVPLTVLIEFKRDAAMLGMAPVFIRSTSEIASLNMLRDQRGAEQATLYLTNYESVREGKIDLSLFNAASLDEASCLRGFGGTKTFREFMRLFDGMRYKFVATATPSPNDYIELLAYAAFLEIMDVGQAKTRFFKRNSEKADELTIHPHKEDEFWLWVNSWAAFVQRPSDLGFSDEGYDLPDLDVRWHEVASDHAAAGADKGGQGLLLKKDAIGVVDASREKRATIDSRVAKMVEIIANERSRKTQGLSEGLLREEQGAAAGEAARAGQAELCSEARDVSGALESLERSQSRAIQGIAAVEPGAERGCDARARAPMVSGQQGASQRLGASGEAEKLRTDGRSLSDDGRSAERGLCDLSAPPETGAPLCGPLPFDESSAGAALSSLQRGDRAVAGESGHDRTGDDLPQQWVVWCDLNDEQRAAERSLIDAGHLVASIDGTTSLDERVRRLNEWRDRKRDTIVSKPVILGSGMNLQQCNRAVFLGIGFKFNDFIQACHRQHRFLQTRRVVIDLIYSEAERAVRRTLEAKWERHRAMTARMSEIIRTYGLGLTGARDVLARSVTSKPAFECAEGPDWKVWEGDTVIQTAQMASDSVGLIVTSVPFGTQYEYSPSYNDFGHTDDSAHFFAQMDYLTPELLRVLQPGRRMAVHVKDRVVPSGMTGLGFRTIEPFHARCIEHYVRHGFAYLGMVTIVTDVVRENAGTYRLGWSEQCKDASGMGVGLPEYLLLFRKPPTDRSNGYADVPVVKGKPSIEYVRDEDLIDDAAMADVFAQWDGKAVQDMRARPVPGTGYSRARWQTDAAGYWRSNGNRTLMPEDLTGLPWDSVYQRVRAWSWATVYDHDGHVALMEGMEARWSLPTDFALMPVQSWHPEVWTDVARMYGANTMQSAKGREQHLCPLPFDIVDRAIGNWSNPGDLVFDPFGGLMTVPLRAVKQGRKGCATELNPGYFADGVSLLREQDAGRATGDLFDLLRDVGEAA